MTPNFNNENLSHPFTGTTLHTPLASKSMERFFSSISFFPPLTDFLPLSSAPLSRRSSSNSATFSSAPNLVLLSQDPLSALLSSYIVSSQKNPTSSNHSTTNIIKPPLLIMVNTICLHEGCKRKPMKHSNGSCHLHGVHRKCSLPQCSNNARRAGVCVYNKQCRQEGGLHQSWCKVLLHCD